MSIEINKKSWHAKLVKAFFDGNSRSLCQYARRLVVSIIVACAFAFVFGLMVWFLFGTPIIALLGLFGVLTLRAGQYTDAIVACSIWGVIILGIVAGCLKGWWDRRPKKQHQNKPKTPSLVMEYIKAKKAKICPTIKFV